MSIGAVRFDPENNKMGDDGFYASISIDSNLVAGRQVSEDTLLWWLKQSSQAQAVFHEPKHALDASLESFNEWFGTGRDAKDIMIWSNGADFDLPMLAHAYHLFGWEPPWQFFNSRCVRTFKNLPGAKAITIEKVGVAHNALSDAINQARLVQAIHANLFGTKRVSA